MSKQQHNIHKYIQLGLSSLCLILIYFIWLQTQPIDMSEIMQSNIHNENQNESEPVFLSVEKTIPGVDEFDEMVNRPLFFESRKPFVFEEVAKEPESKKRKTNVRKSREEYSLNAVVITPEKQIAILQSNKAKELQRVALGEMINDWKLEAIDPREVKLTRGNETKNLVLEIKNSSPKAKQKTTETSSKQKENIKTSPVEEQKNAKTTPAKTNISKKTDKN